MYMYQATLCLENKDAVLRPAGPFINVVPAEWPMIANITELRPGAVSIVKELWQTGRMTLESGERIELGSHTDALKSFFDYSFPYTVLAVWKALAAHSGSDGVSRMHLMSVLHFMSQDFAAGAPTYSFSVSIDPASLLGTWMYYILLNPTNEWFTRSFQGIVQNFKSAFMWWISLHKETLSFVINHPNMYDNRHIDTIIAERSSLERLKKFFEEYEKTIDTQLLNLGCRTGVNPSEYFSTVVREQNTCAYLSPLLKLCFGCGNLNPLSDQNLVRHMQDILNYSRQLGTAKTETAVNISNWLGMDQPRFHVPSYTYPTINGVFRGNTCLFPNMFGIDMTGVFNYITRQALSNRLEEKRRQL